MSKEDENVEIKEKTITKRRGRPATKTKTDTKNEATASKTKTTSPKEGTTNKAKTTTKKEIASNKVNATEKKEGTESKKKTSTKPKTTTTIKKAEPKKKETKNETKEIIKKEEKTPKNEIKEPVEKIVNEEINEEKALKLNTKFDTVSLKEIRETLENKVDKKQKKSVIKEVFINLSIAIILIIYLVLIMIGSKNLLIEVLEKDVKIITLCILAIGIFILEQAYKKDNTKIAMNAIELLTFGASNICLIYVLKLYFNNLTNVLTCITLGVGGYYIFKCFILTFNRIKSFKRENNDIKEIIKKI